MLQRSTDAPAVLHAADLKDAYTCSHCLQNSYWYDTPHPAQYTAYHVWFLLPARHTACRVWFLLRCLDFDRGLVCSMCIPCSHVLACACLETRQLLLD